MNQSSLSFLPDERERKQAATDFEHNLVVLAGAGAGKTSLLIERLLNGIGSGIVGLEQIAAITFTEKAAGEMRQRLAQGLDRLRALARGEHEIAGDADEAARSYRYLVGQFGASNHDVALRALQAMEALDRTRIVTIHSFCSELLRAYPLEAGVDPGFRVDTGEHAVTIQRTVWEGFLARRLGPGAEPDGVQRWRTLLDRFTLEQIRLIAFGLAGFAIPIDCIQPPYPSVGEVLDDPLTRLAADIEPLAGNREQLSPTAAQYFLEVHQVLTTVLQEGLEPFRTQLHGNQRLRTRIQGKTVSFTSKKLEIMTEKRMCELAARAQTMTKHLDGIDEDLIPQLLEALLPYVEEFRERYLELGFVSFDGLLALARDLLRDHPRVRDSLKRRYRMLLVDEFQDTDPLQYEIVLFLAGTTGQNGRDAFAEDLEPGRLFVVGDAKQSIYRFRGADFGAYRTALARIVEAGGQSVELASNFRSVPGVIEPVNRLFGGRDWQASSFQPEYVPIEAVRRPRDATPCIEIWTPALDAGSNAEQRRRAEGRRIAEQIARWVREERCCEYRQITILLRAFSNIALYLRPLRELGIPFVVDGGREFLERPEVTQLMAILRSVAQPSDAPALLAYLRSPAGGVSDRELAAYAAGGGPWNWKHAEDVDATCFPAVSAALGAMLDLSRTTLHLPADAVIRRILQTSRMIPLGAAAFEGPQRVANLRKLAAAAADLARDGSMSLEQVVEALEQGHLADIETDRPLADDAAEAVRITSIHRMKGLENDRIIVPDLARGKMSSLPTVASARTATLSDGRQVLAISVGPRMNPAQVRYAAEDRDHQNAEEARVLYVALTRARERMILVAAARARAATWVDTLAAWGYDPSDPPDDGALLDEGRILHRRPEPISVDVPTREISPDLADRAVEQYELAVATCLSRTSPPFVTPSSEEAWKVREFSDETSDHPRGTVGREIGRAVGIVLHQALEAWDAADPDTLRKDLTRRCALIATEEQVSAASLIAETSEIVERFLESPLGRRRPTLEVLGREVPLLLRTDNGQVYRGSIDLLFRDEDGRTVVADYKTDREADDLALIERYGPQLAVYAEAVRRAWSEREPPRRELWLLRHGRTVQLP